MNYYPQSLYRPDIGHGAVPVSVLIIQTLMPGQIPHLRDPMGVILLKLVRLRPFKLAASHKRVARYHVPGQPHPVKDSPMISLAWRKTGNVSSVNGSD